MYNPKIQIIIPPEKGWKPNTLYLVEISFRANNPIHASTFFTGFLDEGGNPCGYNQITTMGMHETWDINSVYYLRAVRILAGEKLLDNVPNLNKLVSELNIDI